VTDVLIDLARVGESAIRTGEEMNSLLEDDAGTKCLLDTGGFAGGEGLSVIENAARALSYLGNFLPPDYDGLIETSEFLHKRIEILSAEVTKPKLGKPYFLIFTIFYIIIPAVLLVGVMSAWYEVDARRLRCILSWLVLPIFCIQVFFASILGVIFIIGSVANADFCSGGKEQTPNDTVTQILRNLGVNPESTQFQIFKFYIYQCQSEHPFRSVEEYFSQLGSSELQFQKLVDALSSVDASLPGSGQNSTRLLAEINVPCKAYAEQIYRITDTVIYDVKSLLDIVVEIFDILKCDSVVPLYTTPTYEGACKQSVSGLTWIFAGFVVMASMGLIMVKFYVHNNFQTAMALLTL